MPPTLIFKSVDCLIVRATQMSYGAWLYIRWSISSSPVAMTSTSACGTLPLISPSGPKHWRWAARLGRFHLHYSSVVSQLTHQFLVIETLVTTATVMKWALLFLRLRCNRICVDRMFDWACMCFPHGQDAAQSAGFHPSGATVAIGTQTGRWGDFFSSTGSLTHHYNSEKGSNRVLHGRPKHLLLC